MAPVPVTIERPGTETDLIEIVDDLDELSESNRCSCNASDDNPY
jgi:hypothetical protein